MSKNKIMREFHVELNLWESYKKRKEVNEMDLIKGYKIYKDIPELATSLGFLERELIEYICDNQQLSVYFSSIKVI